jgi:hypothetical protein
MPAIRAIIDYWRDNPQPFLKSWYIGWGEPFCFACGWLAPVADGRPDSWARASAWLDRAHLHERVFGGSDDPSNLVMLCHLCHDVYPAVRTREGGLEWVAARPDCDELFQAFTDRKFLDRQFPPTRSATMIRAHRDYLQIICGARELVGAA